MKYGLQTKQMQYSLSLEKRLFIIAQFILQVSEKSSLQFSDKTIYNYQLYIPKYIKLNIVEIKINMVQRWEFRYCFLLQIKRCYSYLKYKN